MLLAFLTLFPGTSFATSYSIPLPDLVGPIDFATAGAYPPTSFDFGQQFSAIESVSIEIEAHLVAAEWEFCGFSYDPRPCVDGAALVGVAAIMDEEDRPYPGTTFASVSVPAPPGTLEVTGTGSSEFGNEFNPFGWEILLDGQGTLTLFPNQILFPPLAIIQNFQSASGEVLSARLIVEGTPVPEPSTALLMMIGLTVLSGAQRRNMFSGRLRKDGCWLARRSERAGPSRRFGPRVAAALVFFAFTSLFPGASFAASFFAPLPGLVGPIDYTTGQIQHDASFEFGQQFTAIESVSIEINARLVAAEYDACGFIFNPRPCVHQISLIGVFLTIDEEDKPFIGTIATGVSVPAAPGTAEVTGTGVAEFRNNFDLNPFGWDILLDGQGSLIMAANSIGFPSGALIENFQPASGEILSARLIIEGAPVPEPSTALFMMIGLTILSGTSRGSGVRVPVRPPLRRCGLASP